MTYLINSYGKTSRHFEYIQKKNYGALKGRHVQHSKTACTALCFGGAPEAQNAVYT